MKKSVSAYQRLSRILLVLLGLIAFQRCGTEETGGPQPLTARLAVTVDLAAARDFIDILDIAQARIRASRSGSVVLDTAVSVSGSSTTVQVSATITLDSQSETFDVLVELSTASGDLVYRSDPSSVTLSSESAAPTPVMLDVMYVGTGSSTDVVQITTTGKSVLAGDTVHLAADALDGDGNPIDGVPIRWRVQDKSEGEFEDAGSGIFTAAASRGAVTVVATTPTGVEDEAVVTVLPRPDMVAVVDGDGQSGPPGQELPDPIVVQVIATDGLPVEGADVNFTTSDGAFSSATAATDAVGRAEVRWTLANQEVLQTGVATVDGFPDATVMFEATASMTPIGGILDAAIAALEDALFIMINDLIRPASLDLVNLDLFSFAEAHDLFAEAHDIDPDDDTAAFGLALTTLLALEDNGALRAAGDAWESWLAMHDELIDLTGGMPPFPSALAQQQDVLRTVVQPALTEAATLLTSAEAADFTFAVTERMQGESPTTASPLELDRTELLGLLSWIRAGQAGIQVALAYQATPNPYGASGFDAALAPGSTFLTLAADGGTRLAEARTLTLESVALANAALDFLEDETDDQSNDIIRLDPTGVYGACNDLPCGLAAMDIQVSRDVLTDLEGISENGQTLTPGMGGADLVSDLVLSPVLVDASAFATDPIGNLKTLLPAYQTSNGEFHWTALSFDEWSFPDPTLNGILPNLTTNGTLKSALNLSGLWETFDRAIDQWNHLTVAAGGTVYAVSDRGDVHAIASDYATGSDRPDLTIQFGFGQRTHLMYNADGSVIQAIDPSSVVFTRPDDAGTAWAAETDLSGTIFCCVAGMVESSAGGTSYILLTFGGHYELSADYATLADRPSLPYDATALTALAGAAQLVAVSQDGLVFSRPMDDASPWVQAGAMLPFDGTFDDYWVSVAPHPTQSTVFAVSRMGNVVELTGNLSTVADRPQVPASSVIALTTSPATDDLIVMTSDGRVFSRPADAATEWTLRFTLPRTVVTAPPMRVGPGR